MTKTKRGFILAGGIIAIITACILLLFGFIFLEAATIVNYQFVCQLLENFGELVYYTSQEISLIVDTSRVLLYVISALSFGFGIALLILGIKLTKMNNKTKNGVIVASLVLGCFVNLIVTAFMIVVLCLKDKPQTDENIENSEDIVV